VLAGLVFLHRPQIVNVCAKMNAMRNCCWNT